MPLIYYYYTDSCYRDSNPNPNPMNYNTAETVASASTPLTLSSSSSEYPVTITEEKKENGIKEVKECIKLKTTSCSKLDKLKDSKKEHKL